MSQLNKSSSNPLNEKVRNLEVEIEKLKTDSKDQKDRFNAQKQLLVQAYSKIQKTVSELRKTQDALIQTEKMAALGKLVASIAHEINTPLGAIGASGEVIKHNLQQGTLNHFNIINSLNKDELVVYKTLMSKSLHHTETTLTSRELRKIKREITQHLSSKIENADDISDSLVELGVYNNVEEFEPIYLKENGNLILESVISIARIYDSCYIIQNSVSKASKIVFSLKSYAHEDNGEFKPISVEKSIEGVLRIYKSNLKNIELTRLYDKTDLIEVIPDQLEQVWINLLFNALQAIDFIGKISISILDKPTYVEVGIMDNGPGIPKDVQPKIFEPFFTTKPKGEGTGLGLSIIKRIINKQNGKISFETNEKGTKFIVKLKKQTL